LAQASVAREYRHAEKMAHAEPSLALGDTVLKWYDVAPDDAPVPLAIRAVARRCLRDAARGDELGTLGELGFVVLHRCGEDFYFLLVSTWRNENELWETVWAKAGEEDVLFRPWPTEGAHRPTFCVWELGVVSHEREAWTRYLLSARDGDAARAYVRDCYAGVV
jgi:hypothetical protein